MSMSNNIFRHLIWILLISCSFQSKEDPQATKTILIPLPNNKLTQDLMVLAQQEKTFNLAGRANAIESEFTVKNYKFKIELSDKIVLTENFLIPWLKSSSIDPKLTTLSLSSRLSSDQLKVIHWLFKFHQAAYIQIAPFEDASLDAEFSPNAYPHFTCQEVEMIGNSLCYFLNSWIQFVLVKTQSSKDYRYFEAPLILTLNKDSNVKPENLLSYFAFPDLFQENLLLQKASDLGDKNFWKNFIP